MHNKIMNAYQTITTPVYYRKYEMHSKESENDRIKPLKDC